MIFKTTSYKAEKGSVLHSGIYSKELTSSLAAGALTLAIALMLFFSGIRLKMASIIFLLIGFAGLFLFFRLMVFYEESLEAVIDKAKGVVAVSVKKFAGKKSVFPLKDVVEVVVSRLVFSPENPDGIKVVEKIALQHGTVIPGFGEEKEFHTVEFRLRDGNGFTVFSGKEKDAEDVRDAIKGFIYA